MKNKKLLCASTLTLLMFVSMIGLTAASLGEPPWVPEGTLDISPLPTPKMYVSTGEPNDWEYNASALGETFTIQIVVDDLPESNSTTSDPYRGCFGFGFRLLYNESLLNVGTWTMDPEGWAAALDTTPFISGPVYDPGKTGFDWTATTPYASPYNDTYGLWTMDPVVIGEITFEVELDAEWPDTLECLLNIDETKIATFIGVTPYDVLHQTRDGVYRFITMPPGPPHADFTWAPPLPEELEVVTFDASASTPDGGYITLYQWRFGDLAEQNTTSTHITHTYTAPGIYTVNLTIYDSDLDIHGNNLTDSAEKDITILEAAVGPAIDVYTDKESLGLGKGGKGPVGDQFGDMSGAGHSSAYAPGDEVFATVEVEYNKDPVYGISVSFFIGTTENSSTYLTALATTFEQGIDWQYLRSNITGWDGVCTIKYRIPYLAELVFGHYLILAGCEIGDKVVMDWVMFNVGWIVDFDLTTMAEVAPDTYAPSTTFVKGQAIHYLISAKNIAFVNSPVAFQIVVTDALGLVIGGIEYLTLVAGATHHPVFDFPFLPTYDMMVVDSTVPPWAFIGDGMVYGNAFDPFWGAYCREIQVAIAIVIP